MKTVTWMNYYWWLTAELEGLAAYNLESNLLGGCTGFHLCGTMFRMRKVFALLPNSRVHLVRTGRNHLGQPLGEEPLCFQRVHSLVLRMKDFYL